MKRILLDGPALEPLSLAEAKAHLRIDADDEDALIGALIGAARVAVETEIRRALIAQSWRAFVDTWPADGVTLPVVPVLSLEAVRAFDMDDTPTELDEETYEFDPADFSVTIDPVPSAKRYEIDFVAGYGEAAANVPAPLRQAMRLLITHWYENRAAVMLSDDPTATPLGYRELVAPYRRVALC
jgi:uncharacterized phiE125 gp8 family phage protein